MFEYRVQVEDASVTNMYTWGVQRRRKEGNWMFVSGGWRQRESAEKVRRVLEEETRGLIRGLGFQIREVVCDKDGRPVECG